MAVSSPLILVNPHLTAGIAPDLGGCLLWLGLREGGAYDVARSTPVRGLAERNVRQSASYPLVPFSNRVGGARFTFDGLEHRIARNFGASPHAIHGVGWQAAWSVREAGPTAATLDLDYVPPPSADPPWPWRFAATQHFVLEASALRITLSVVNTDTRPMPAGIGLHPFFPKTPRATLRFDAGGVWINGATMLPERRVDTAGEWDFSRPRPLAALAVDNCFAGWRGHARIDWPERGLGLAIDADPVYDHLVVFTTPDRDCVAVEPVSHVNDALNLGPRDGAMRRLEPGESLSGSVRFVLLDAVLERAAG